MINRGMPIDTEADMSSDFVFINKEEPEKICSDIVKMVKTLIPKKYNYDPIKDIQILSPMKKGEIGISNLNLLLQNELNNNPVIYSSGFKSFKIGDKVMQVKNNYDKDIYNGDTGIISGCNTVDQMMSINYDGRIVDYDFSELDEVTLAYATSIHKSQGSEYKCVIIPIHTQHYIMLKRNLLYTGVTRAKNNLFLIGTSKALNIAINNNEMSKRNTNLRSLFK
jgi:exodeoxyribonuclease V alpha subunit